MAETTPQKDLSPIHLQMINAPPEEYEVQQTRRAGVTRIARRYPTSLDKYYGAYKRDENKGISTAQHGAGIHFMRVYHTATKSLSCKLASLDSVGGGQAMQDAILESSHEILKAIRAMEGGTGGRTAAKIIERICGWNETTVDCEKFYNWPTGHAIIRLREGLDDLVEHYLDVQYGKVRQTRD